jgi:uncharacterized lipoprotein YmbA
MIKILSILLFVVFAFSGCAGNEPNRFYLLTPATGPAIVADAPEQNSLNIVIGPIRLPDYLNRTQIVTRVSDNELELGWSDRWAEPLDRNFSRTLAQNLEQLLRCRCSSALASRLPPGTTHRIEADVVRMDGVLGQKAFLDVWWSIYTPEKKILLARKSSFVQPVKGRGYEALVQAESENLFAFSREIAIAIAEMTILR